MTGLLYESKPSWNVLKHKKKSLKLVQPLRKCSLQTHVEKNYKYNIEHLLLSPIVLYFLKVLCRTSIFFPPLDSGKKVEMVSFQYQPLPCDISLNGYTYQIHTTFRRCFYEILRGNQSATYQSIEDGGWQLMMGVSDSRVRYFPTATLMVKLEM